MEFKERILIPLDRIICFLRLYLSLYISFLLLLLLYFFDTLYAHTFDKLSVFGGQFNV
jgi:hypothetical protein